MDGKNTFLYVNIRKDLGKGTLSRNRNTMVSQENKEHYGSPMVGVFQLITKCYIWYVGTEKSANLALHNY